MKEAYAVRRTVPPSAEIEAQIDQLLAVGVGENRGLGAQPVTAAFADPDAEAGASAGVDDVEQAGGADRCGIGAIVARELDGVGLRVASARCPPVDDTPAKMCSSTHFSWLSVVAIPR